MTSDRKIGQMCLRPGPKEDWEDVDTSDTRENSNIKDLSSERYRCIYSSSLFVTGDALTGRDQEI